MRQPLVFLWVSILIALLAIRFESFAQETRYELRGYREFTHRVETLENLKAPVIRHSFIFSDTQRAGIFVSKIFSDYELSQGNEIVSVPTTYGPADAVLLSGSGYLLPLLTRQSKTVSVLVSADRQVLLAQANQLLKSPPLRRSEVTHPLYMDKWDRYPLGVWQAIGDYTQDGLRNTPDTFYEWMGKIGLNPQINLGNQGIDLASNDNQLLWLCHYFTKYGVKYQRVQWLEHNLDLYNRNPYLTQSINPHVMARWIYYGEMRDASGLLRDVQNASFLLSLKRIKEDQNQMAILDPNGEIGPFQFQFWGASGPAHQRNFVRYLREVRKFTLEEVSRRWYGKIGALKNWEDVTLADWREFYGWTQDSVDFAGEWHIMRDEQLEGFGQGWMLPDYDDSDWVRLYYPGDTTLYSLATREKPLWMRRSLQVDISRFSGRLYLSVAPLCESAVQVYLNGKRLGTLDPRFHTACVIGQFDVTETLRQNSKVTVALRFAAGDVPNGPIFLTSKKMEDFPTSDPLLNARRFDHMDYVDWAVADSVRTTLLAVRSVDRDRPIKVHAFESCYWGWKMLQELGAYSHHTGSGAGWSWTVPKQRGLTRNLQDSSEPGGPMSTLRDLKGLFGNLVFMGKNAHDYFINLQSITRDPAMRQWFEEKLPAIKVMGRANLNSSPIAALRGLMNTRYVSEFSHEEDWRFGLDFSRGGEMTPLLDEVRLREGHLPYRAVVDEGTRCWDDVMTAVLKAYVEDGGILVLNCLSGIHSFTQRKAGLGPTLAGVRIVGDIKEDMQITLTDKDPLLTGMKGSVPAYHRPADPNTRIEILTGTEILGTYSDNSPALTRRQVGKGIVYFCSTSQYPATFLRELTRKVGLSIYASVEGGGVDLIRTLRSNNGSEDLLMLRGLGKPTTVHWTFDYTPSAIYDPVSGKALDVKIDDKTATFTVNIPDWDFAWFTSRRPDAEEQFSHWLKRQAEIWSGLVKNTSPLWFDLPTKPDPVVPLFRHLDLNRDWKLVQTDSVSKVLELMKMDDKAAGLQPTELILWDTPGTGLRTGKDIVGFYRRYFTLPKGWEKDNLLHLTLRGPVHDSPLQGFFGQGSIYLNGAKIWEGNRIESACLEVTPLVKPGQNRLEIIHEGKGIMPGILLIRSAKPDNTMNLAGSWQAVESLQSVRQVQLPDKVETAFVYQDISIPSGLSDKEVWLRVEGNCSFVIINGRLRYWDLWGVPMYTELPGYQVNITPDIRFGQQNRLVLGTNAMLQGWQKVKQDYKQIELSFYTPGRWTGDGKGIREALSRRELTRCEQVSKLIQLYPMVNSPVKKPDLLATKITSAEASSYRPPSSLLDLDLTSPAGKITDKSTKGIPVLVTGTVTPFTENGSQIKGVYLQGENNQPGMLEIPAQPFRRELAGKNFTICTWVKPMAINRVGGSLANWCSYVFDWRLQDNSVVFAVFDQRLKAESVLRQRQWQFLAYSIKGTESTLFVNGVEVGGQQWKTTFPGSDAPFTIGGIKGHQEFLNAKLASFVIYEQALTSEEIAKLYLKERLPYVFNPEKAWLETELFHLDLESNKVSDNAEIPGRLTLGPGVKINTTETRPSLTFDGKDSFLIINEHDRVHLLHEPFSLLFDFRPALDAAGMIFRRHHEICFELTKDGSLILDANIGQNKRQQFSQVVTHGAWNRFMLTYDGKTASLHRDGKLLMQKEYPGTLCMGRFPLSICADNTLPNNGNKLACELREFRIIPRILTTMPEVDRLL